MEIGSGSDHDNDSNANIDSNNGNGNRNRNDRDDVHIGVIKGIVPVSRETQRIFHQIHSTSTSSSSASHGPQRDPIAPSDTISELQLKSEMQNNSSPLFPLLNVTIQTTRGGPQILVDCIVTFRRGKRGLLLFCMSDFNCNSDMVSDGAIGSR